MAKKSKKINGDTVMMLVAMITANPQHNIELNPENIDIIMSKMPLEMKGRAEVRQLVTTICNG